MEDFEGQGSAEDRFGRRVRVERERLMWTQSDLARHLLQAGLTLHPSAIAKIELRDVERPRSIRLEEAQAIAQVFNLSVDEMYENGKIRAARLMSQSRSLAEKLLELALEYEAHIGELSSYLSGLSSDQLDLAAGLTLSAAQRDIAESLGAVEIGSLLAELRVRSREPSILRRRTAERDARDQQRLVDNLDIVRNEDET